MPTTKSTCCYCGVGCGVVISSDAEGRITDIQGDPDHPANYGRLCTKGRTLHLTTGASGRLLYPEIRRERRAARQRSDWNTTLNYLADRFAATIREHGPDSVAFYISGQLLTEDYYAFNKLARALVGTNNIDSNSRLCMSSAVAGYKTTLGSDAPPACYDDIAHTDCLLIAGSNAAWAHPVLFRRIEDARERNPDLKIIVIDPRRTATAEIADLHLAIQPGTDVALFNGLLHLLLWEELIDSDYIAQHTSGYAEARAAVRDYTPAFVAEICGVRAEDIVTAARWFGSSRAALSLWCMGLNQSTRGTDKNTALINLHLATGQIGRPGAGPFSLTGQPNAMGGREVGAMANLFPGHRDPANPEHRADLARLWQVPSVPEAPGKTAIEMFEAVRDGRIKLLWIACTNPAQSLPAQALAREALGKAELVILQEAFADTETAAYADVILPAATWGEKDGTMTNSERRVSRVRRAVAPPGEARPDWEIATDFAKRLAQRLHPGRTALFDFKDSAAVFDEHKALTGGRDLDITGLSHAVLDTQGPQQWPYPAGATTGTVRLYADGRYPTADGRARFGAPVYVAVAEKIDARHPFSLLTGRLRDQWHGMSRTGRTTQLFGHTGEPRLTMHPADMARRGLRSGDLVHVQSRRGRVTLTVESGDEVARGQVFLPMHWGSRYLGGSGSSGVNAVTLPSFDAVSRQPELKHSAVRIEKAMLPWQLVAFCYPAAATLQDFMARIAALMSHFPYAMCVPLGRRNSGVLLRVAAANPPTDDVMELIDALFTIDTLTTLRYDDARRSIGRRIRLQDARVAAVRLSGDLGIEGALREEFLEQRQVTNTAALLAGRAGPTPPGRNRQVCNCWGVTEGQIAEAIPGCHGTADQMLEQLKSTLRCGTSCGSCIPELKRMVSTRRIAA